MAENDLFDHLRALRRQLEETRTMTSHIWNSATLNSVSWWSGDEGEGRFDPKMVDWEKLIELYGDDPALTFIFGQLEEYFLRRGDPILRWDPSLSTGSGTYTPGLHLYTTTATPMTVSKPVTIRYNGTGGISYTTDEE